MNSKNIVLASLLFFMFTACLVWAQGGGPSKEETVEFLRDKLEEFGLWHYLGRSTHEKCGGMEFYFRYHTKIREGNESDHIINVVKEGNVYCKWETNEIEKSTESFFIPLEKMNPKVEMGTDKGWALLSHKGDIEIKIKCLKGECVEIFWESKDIDAGKDYSENKKFREVNIYLNSENKIQAEKIAKAFRHLILISGGKEKKELF